MRAEGRVRRCKNMTELHTERCRIRTFLPSDIASAMPLFTDQQVRAYLGGPVSPETARERLTQRCEPGGGERYFAVTLPDGTFVGLIDLAPYCDGVNTELSYMFLPDFWGCGLASESIRCVLAYCRMQMKLEQVVSETQAANVRSRAMLERLGYRMSEKLVRYGAEQCVYVFDFCEKSLKNEKV